VGIYYLIAIAYRGGFMSLMIAGLSATFGLGALALFNLAVPLPANWQRALSPFPGTWEERHVQAADQSTEWRIEMWKEALLTEFWIQNKLLGDGLGFSRRELQMMEAMEVGQAFTSMGSGLSAQQETMMITGGYHSGPVQTIRTVGYVGLIVLMLAMIRVAVHGHREVLRCRGTEWYPLALFMVIPSVALPFVFTFVFGEFKTASSISTSLQHVGHRRRSRCKIKLPQVLLLISPHVTEARRTHACVHCQPPYTFLVHENAHQCPDNP
jgi:hypothetical protein